MPGGLELMIWQYATQSYKRCGGKINMKRRHFSAVGFSTLTSVSSLGIQHCCQHIQKGKTACGTFELAQSHSYTIQVWMSWISIGERAVCTAVLLKSNSPPRHTLVNDPIFWEAFAFIKHPNYNLQWHSLNTPQSTSKWRGYSLLFSTLSKRTLSKGGFCGLVGTSFYVAVVCVLLSWHRISSCGDTQVVSLWVLISVDVMHTFLSGSQNLHCQLPLLLFSWLWWCNWLHFSCLWWCWWCRNVG